MLVNRTVVLPTDETRDYLASVLSGSPVDINLDSFHIVLLDTMDPVVLNSKAVYTVEATAFKQWYNEATQQGALILSLQSADLQARYEELTASHKDRWYTEYSPYMVVVPYANPDRLHQRRFIGSIANALCSMNNATKLQFSFETQFALECNRAPYEEYHNSIIGNG